MSSALAIHPRARACWLGAARRASLLIAILVAERAVTTIRMTEWREYSVSSFVRMLAAGALFGLATVVFYACFAE